MRLHITLGDDLVAQLDARVGQGRRSAFIAEAVRRALADKRCWQDVEGGFGVLGREHEWDADSVGGLELNEKATRLASGSAPVCLADPVNQIADGLESQRAR
jgi:Arc/MetJ-type ribon-helix-helix transcriptional regulator